MESSNDKQTFSTGAQRDTHAQKPRPDLMSPYAALRIGEILRAGAEHYGDRNWEKGIPISRCIASLERHLVAYKQGLRNEDHMAQLACNAMFILHNEEAIRLGILPQDLDDMPKYETGMTRIVSTEAYWNERNRRLTPNPAFTNGLPLVPDTYAGYWTSVVKREENSVNGRTFICYQVAYGYQRRIVHDKNLTVIYGPWYLKTKSFIGLINEGRFIKYTGPSLEFIGRWNTADNAAEPGEWQLDSYGVVRYRSPNAGTIPAYLSSENLIGGIRSGTFVRSTWKAGAAHKFLGFWKFRRPQSVESYGCWEIRVDESVWFYSPSGRRGPVRSCSIDTDIEYIEKGEWEEYPDGKYLGFRNEWTGLVL